MFDNKLFTIEYLSDVHLSGHTLISDISELVYDHAAPCFLMTFGLLFLVTLGYLLKGLSELCCKDLFGSELNVDENLGNYFNALEMDDKKWMVMEEENIRNNYVLILMTNYLIIAIEDDS